jgi:hypothetical protein
MHKFDQRKREILDDPKRFFFENPDKIISEAGLKPGEEEDHEKNFVFNHLPDIRFLVHFPDFNFFRRA